jgi:hypothetical protein
MKPPAPSAAGFGSCTAVTAPQNSKENQENILSRSSDSLSSSFSNCLAQADSHSRGLEDRTDRDSMITTPSRLSGMEG